jgi:DNA mismatch repair protein MutL
MTAATCEQGAAVFLYRGLFCFKRGFVLSGKIVILPEDLTRKIAAGEVVERPASIVKELLENALDAGATNIIVELERGGCSSIRVIDNGEGIDLNDISLAFERYATSKIYEFDDIYKVASYGFRGEALPSIASISRVEMITRKRSSLSGTKIVVEAGQVKMISEVGCPLGTSVFVSRIFDPVPVRKKFLKSDSTEQGQCVDVVTKMALAHPGVRLSLTANGKDILNIAATGNESERISLILGMDFMHAMLPVKLTKEDTICHGFISRPEQTRSSAKHIYFYVNKRYVRDYFLNHAVMTAYRRLVEPRRYPSAVLFFDLPKGDVDVNIHPSKMEVRFRNPRNIYDITVETLVNALARISPHSEKLAAPGSPENGGSKHPAGYRMRVEEALKRYSLSSGHGKLFFSQGDVHSWKGRQEQEDLLKRDKQVTEQPEAEGKNIVFSELEYLGQLAATYLVFISPEGLTIIDQHAAHERILYEKMKSGSYQEGDRMPGQRLLLPEIVSLAPGDFTFLMECMDILEDMGIEVEPFGGTSVVVKSIPVMLMHVQPRDMVTDLLDAFSTEERRMRVQERKEKIFAFLACKGAVKANRQLSSEEVTVLCHDLDNTSFSATCPHGRPVHVSFGLKDIEKMFKRR